MHLNSSRQHKIILILLILFGISLRIGEYVKNRSLWHDEANVVMKIRDMPFNTMIQADNPTESRMQAIPAGFILLQKTAYQFMGDAEWVWRLLPLLSGIAALFFFASLADKCLTPVGSLCATGLFAISRDLIYYSSEVKPYAGDVLIAVILGIIFLRVCDPSTSRKDFIGLGLAGAIAVWFSFPAVFILAGAGGAWLIDLTIHKQWSVLRRFLPTILIWSISFLCYYFYSLRDFTQHQMIAYYWQEYFMPLHDGIPACLLWTADITERLFRENLQYPALLAVPASAFGAWHLFHRKRHLFYFLIMPLAICFGLSIIGRYPFGGRVLSFTFPALILLIMTGIEQFILRRPVAFRPICTGVIMGLLLIHPVTATARQATTTTGIEEIKPILAYIREHKEPDDAIVIYFASMPAFLYYHEHYGLTNHWVKLTRNPLHHDIERGYFLKPPNFHRGWFIFTHISYYHGQVSLRKATLSLLDDVGTQIDHLEVPTTPDAAPRYAENGISASVYLYEIGESHD